MLRLRGMERRRMRNRIRVRLEFTSTRAASRVGARVPAPNQYQGEAMQSNDTRSGLAGTTAARETAWADVKQKMPAQYERLRKLLE
jgi:hypothetical protein